MCVVCDFRHLRDVWQSVHDVRQPAYTHEDAFHHNIELTFKWLTLLETHESNQVARLHGRILLVPLVLWYVVLYVSQLIQVKSTIKPPQTPYHMFLGADFVQYHRYHAYGIIPYLYHDTDMF